LKCSIVIPVHGRAGLTRQCLDAVFADPPAVDFEVIVVDDASPEPAVPGEYRDRITVVTRRENGGFARACNDGAAAATGDHLVFLNNDTVPQAGWLDALAATARDDAVGAVGSKLLFPNGTIQHAGVVICQDGHPRHLYAGFPADHPAVNKPRRFQAVTAASMLVRRDAFERAGGFDDAFRNSLEDTDLCLRLGRLDLEVRYCPDSVVGHLESASRPRRGDQTAANTRLFMERWGDVAERDDLRYYVEDGLLRLRYRDLYPLRIELAPELAIAAEQDPRHLVELQAHQVAGLLRETVRLSALVAEVELSEAADARPSSGPAAPAPAEGLAGLVADAERLQVDIHAFQERIAEALATEQDGPAANGQEGFTPSDHFAYVDRTQRLRPVVEAIVPPGETVLVVSRGDESLVTLPGRDGRHFPLQDGAYAGRHPADSAEAIAQLEEQRARGARYLVIPRDDAWWLDHYADFGRHLAERYEMLTHPEAPCLVFRLG
jgi:GT2 family glycosyltransferase